MPKKKRIFYEGEFLEKKKGKHGYSVFKPIPGLEYLKKKKR